MNIIEDCSEFNPDAEPYFLNYFPTLHEEQIAIYESVVVDIESGDGGLHKIDAPCGSGKTHLANLTLAFGR